MTHLTSSLRTHFGFTSFRAGQAEAIQSLLNKQHTLVVMPTGAGKSLIFQLAALQLDGLTLVISPLIALMKDQVDNLTRRNLPATYINSALPVSEQNLRLQNLSQNKYRLMYVAPERLRNTQFLNALKTQTVGLLAVDEAHCISEWGHDFRPDYLHIAQARAALGNPLTAALTATATPQVQKDIIRLLGLGDSTRIVTGFNRPNLTLDVRYASGLPSKPRAVKQRKEDLKRGDLCLVTPYSPHAGFSVGAAMGRNRLIYCLADYAIVVASDAETGGTWAGATETLKNNWIPVFVLEHDAMPEGNKLLLQKGALAFPHPFKEPPVQLPEWMKEQVANLPAQPSQPSLF